MHHRLAFTDNAPTTARAASTASRGHHGDDDRRGRDQRQHVHRQQRGPRRRRRRSTSTALEGDVRSRTRPSAATAPTRTAAALILTADDEAAIIRRSPHDLRGNQADVPAAAGLFYGRREGPHADRGLDHRPATTAEEPVAAIYLDTESRGDPSRRRSATRRSSTTRPAPTRAAGSTAGDDNGPAPRRGRQRCGLEHDRRRQLRARGDLARSQRRSTPARSRRFTSLSV